MIFALNQSEKEIFDVIQEAATELQEEVYVVGGYVRDKILGRPSNDIDVVTVGDGIKLAKNVASKLTPIPRIVIYKRFGTAMINHRGLEIEFVGARKESYTFDSRNPKVSQGSLEDDQNRRDFTINALAISLNENSSGELLDPFGGLNDLKSKTIRTPLEPEKTFSDDPLRMLRAIRFATQLNYEIEEETLESIAKLKYRIGIISKERITSELNKIILSEKPSIGFKLLYDTGLLELILPEMTALQGVEIKNGIGHKDNFYHTIEVLDNIAKNTEDLWLRWAAILHDIAKPKTKRFDDKSGWTFHGHEVVGSFMVPKIFKRLRLPLDNKMKFVQKLVRLHLRPISLTKENITDSAVRRLLFDAGDDIDNLMTLCKADITSKNPTKVKRYLANYDFVQKRIIEVEKKDEIRNWQPPISGEMIMETFGIKPSKQVGVIKDAIREAILDGDIQNNLGEAHQLMMRLGKEMGLSEVEKV